MSAARHGGGERPSGDRTRGRGEALMMGSAARGFGARGSMYRLMAEAFLPPREDFPPGAILTALSEAAESVFGPALRHRLRDATALAERTPLAALAAEHRKLFVGPGALGAPPFESVYRGGRMMGPAAADMTKILQAVGRHVSPDRTLLPDHLVVELSLVADLVDREEVGSTHLRSLLEDHLAQWLPAFVRRLEDASANPFYLELARLADRLVGIDLAGGVP